MSNNTSPSCQDNSKENPYLSSSQPARGGRHYGHTKAPAMAGRAPTGDLQTSKTRTFAKAKPCEEKVCEEKVSAQHLKLRARKLRKQARARNLLTSSLPTFTKNIDLAKKSQVEKAKVPAEDKPKAAAEDKPKETDGGAEKGTQQVIKKRKAFVKPPKFIVPAPVRLSAL